MYLTAMAIAVVIRLALLILPPPFATDVSYYNAQAVGYLLRGIDPYGAAYSVPASLATKGASNVFAYLPGLFAVIAPAGAVWDAKAGLVVCDFVVAGSLLFIGGARRWLYASAYLLFPPTFLFSSWFPNDGLPSMAFLSVAVALESRKRPMEAALFWGAAVASSQQVWLAFPLYAYYCLRYRRYADVLLALGVAAAIIVPFLWWNPSAFVYDTVIFQFARQAVPFLSSGPFGLNINPSLQGIFLALGTSAPLVARGAAAALALVLSFRLVRSSLTSLMLACTAFVFVALFLLSGELFWAYLELPFVTLLLWVALRGVEREQNGLEAFKA